MIENNAIDLLRRIETLTATTDDVESYNKIIPQASESGEKACRRRRPEFYSNQINSLRIRFSVALGHYNQLRKHNQYNVDGFQSRLQRASTTIEFKHNPKEAYQVYKNLRRELQEATKHSRDIREAKLAARIHDKHEEGSPEYLIRLQNIKKGEATRRAWQRMKFLRTQTGATQSLNRIDIPASWPPLSLTDNHSIQLKDPVTCTVWRTITNPDEIEQYIRLRNRGHFSQAQGTPFTELPLRDDINWSSDTSTSNNILNGYHQLETIDSIPQCKALLDACKSAATLDLLPYQITDKEFEQKISIWREATTTLPSGRHLGHYKTLFTQFPTTVDSTNTDGVSLLEKQTLI
jgi:hypothetical protein